MDNLNKNFIISVSNCIALFVCLPGTYIIILSKTALCETLKYGEIDIEPSLG